MTILKSGTMPWRCLPFSILARPCCAWDQPAEQVKDLHLYWQASPLAEIVEGQLNLVMSCPPVVSWHIGGLHAVTILQAGVDAQTCQDPRTGYLVSLPPSHNLSSLSWPVLLQ